MSNEFRAKSGNPARTPPFEIDQPAVKSHPPSFSWVWRKIWSFSPSLPDNKTGCYTVTDYLPLTLLSDSLGLIFPVISAPNWPHWRCCVGKNKGWQFSRPARLLIPLSREKEEPAPTNWAPHIFLTRRFSLCQRGRLDVKFVSERVSLSGRGPWRVRNAIECDQI